MLLTIKQLQVKYGDQTALQINSPISFGKGERIGVIGSNGAGKTTLVKAILGLANYDGRIITDLQPEQMAAHMQSNAYVTTMPVRRIMEMVLDTRVKENKELQELIDFFEFRNCLSKRFPALSGGQKQKFTIIMIMMQKAELTFYDEVTSGLDFEELEQLADKILLLDRGRVVAFGRTDELFRTYCGDAIFILDNNRVNCSLTKEFRTLKSPNHLLAVSCRDREEEKRLLTILVDHQVNFKRSNSDIEIMSINARERFYAQGENR